MKNIQIKFLGAFVISFLCVANSICESQSSSSFNFKIINGAPASTKGSPIGLVITKDFFGRTGICSGSLIGPTAVLTAWHCVDQVSRNNIRVKFGEKFFSLSSFYIHPKIKIGKQDGFLYNDLAILRLRRKPRGVKQIPLLTSVKTSPGAKISIAGYGRDQFGKIGVLNVGTATIAAVTRDHFITHFTGISSNTCNGDSGGPALAKNKNNRLGLIGTTSFGTVLSCGLGDTSFYINLQSSSAISFIKKRALGVVFN
ncbi:MAG TPA: trypsin-like serine protease [Oligoflexia bacterium]|nr:trypsin-like serine protease [Oligoflexia bacterium]HMP26922.1 trypsin-like serine protease [Oligoflexia bacterium]